MDLYPNDGTYFQPTEPETQTAERRIAESKAAAGKAVIKDLITRFEDRITFYDTINSIPADVRADPDLFMLTVNANDMVKRVLTAEKEYLEQLI